MKETNSKIDAFQDGYETGFTKGQNERTNAYLMAFGAFVPLGGEDADPEKMAKAVTEMWGEKCKEMALPLGNLFINCPHCKKDVKIKIEK